MPRCLRQRAVRAVTTQGTVDQVWMVRAHRRGTKAEALHNAGPGPLNQHIGLSCQRQQCRPTFVGLQVQPTERLSRIQRRMKHGCTIRIARAKLEHAVALWRFNL
jgi:hypothetical protein